MAETALESGVQTTEEVDASPTGRVRRWLHEWNSASAEEKEWREEAGKVWDLYQSKQPQDNSFNILWSNTETLRPACYNSTPRPDVRRRFRDADPQGKVASTILERALTYSVDVDNFDHHIQMVVLDVLLPSRGIARIKYEPVFEKVPVEAGNEDWLDEQPEPEEQVVDESAPVEHVMWKRFRRGPGKTWSEVTWIGFEHEMPYDQLVSKFGKEIADKLPLSKLEGGNYGDKDVRNLQRTSCVIEIWDKTTKKAMFFSEGYKAGPLLEAHDPLNLSGFFPVPRPIYAIEDATTLVPGVLYKKYEAQAKELNRITLRINKVINALKVRGAYSAHLSEVRNIIEADDNTMVAIENASEIANMGGLDKAIWLMPVDRLVQVLAELYKGRSATLQTIYEITGLGDVMRGVSNPHETLGAQKIKSQWGSLRLQRLQREIQRFIRDLIRMKAEIIAEHFSYQTLAAMTGVQLPTNAEKQQIQAQMALAQTNPAMAQQMQAQVAQMQKMLQMPSWEDVMAILKSDQMRQYRIDIETDSTVNETVERDAQGMQESINAIVQLFGGLAPAIQAGYMKVDVAKSLALAVARTVRMGQAVEDAVEQIEQPPAGPDPMQMQEEIKKAKADLDKQAKELESRKKEAEKAEFAAQKAARDVELKIKDLQVQQATLDADRKIAGAEHKVRESDFKAKVSDTAASLATEASKISLAKSDAEKSSARAQDDMKAADSVKAYLPQNINALVADMKNMTEEVQAIKRGSGKPKVVKAKKGPDGTWDIQAG